MKRFIAGLIVGSIITVCLTVFAEHYAGSGNSFGINIFGIHTAQNPNTDINGDGTDYISIDNFHSHSGSIQLNSVVSGYFIFAIDENKDIGGLLINNPILNEMIYEIYLN